MGTSRTGAALMDPTTPSITLAPRQKVRIASIAKRQGISTSEVILRSLDTYEEQERYDDDIETRELIRQMQAVLEESLASLREARQFADETNRLILHYRLHPELVLDEVP